MIIETLMKHTGSLVAPNFLSISVNLCLLSTKFISSVYPRLDVFLTLQQMAHSSLLIWRGCPFGPGCVASAPACCMPRLCPHHIPPPCRVSSQGRGNGRLQPRRHRAVHPSTFAAVKTARHTRESIADSESVPFS